MNFAVCPIPWFSLRTLYLVLSSATRFSSGRQECLPHLTAFEEFLQHVISGLARSGFLGRGAERQFAGAFFSGLFSRSGNALRRYQLFPAQFRYSLARLGLYATWSRDNLISPRSAREWPPCAARLRPSKTQYNPK